MTLTWKQATLAVVALAAVHVSLAFMPGPKLSPAINLVLFATNVYVLYCAAVVLAKGPNVTLGLFALGYFILFVLLMVILDRKPLFILFIVAYASAFHSRFLLGLFSIFVLSFVVLQPFAAETFLPLAAIYVLLWKVRATSRFVWICLAGGLVALTIVLFPLIHLAIQDSAQTLWFTAMRPDVQTALWVSVGSATVATLVVTLWGTPLAYALARTQFPGKGIVESVIDLPILVPQSVVAIALMVLLGPGGALGRSIEETFGIRFAGTFVGIVIAQVFVASPFLIKTAMTAFEAVPDRLEAASRTLGASAFVTFVRIALPLASRGILVGMILAWARAISEFGAIILFASSPVSGPVLVHTEFLRAGASESRPIATLMLLIFLWVFILLQFGKTLLPFAAQRTARPGVS